MVEDINAFIRAKEAAPGVERVNPEEIIQSIREEFAKDLESRRIAWSEPSECPKIAADRLGITRVFRNLVDNALKYGGENLRKIEIGYDDAEEFHIFTVADDGVGIRREDCEKVFDIFRRSSSTGHVEGTGLGLSIVKEIVEKHMGGVRAEPRNGGGTVIRLSISKRI